MLEKCVSLLLRRKLFDFGDKIIWCRSISYIHDPTFRVLVERTVTDLKKGAEEEHAGEAYNVGSKTHTLNTIRNISAAIDRLDSDLKELKTMIGGESDAELVQAACEEEEVMSDELVTAERQLMDLVVPQDEGVHADSMILEVKCGVGGEEGMLFAGELLRMYKLYCQGMAWDCQVVYEANIPDTLVGQVAVRDTHCRVEGPECYKLLRFEGGVHRVQRIPVTDLNGRVHTSTAVIAVLPEIKQVDIEFKEGDLKIDVMRSSGPGGQHVNKIASKVMITHLPTGTIVECQEDRSQLKNREKAMQKLRDTLQHRQWQTNADKSQNQRKLQVGGRERSEKIRTYNFSKDRITDHRLKMNFNRIGPTLETGMPLHRIIQQLQIFNLNERLHIALEKITLENQKQLIEEKN